MSKPSWDAELQDYIGELRVSGKCKQYVSDVSRYMKHLATYSGVDSFRELTRPQVVAWMGELSEKGVTGKPRPDGGMGLKDITLRSTVGKLKTFLRHLHGGVFPNCVQNLPRLNVGNGSKVKTPSELLTEDEIEAIGDHLRQPWKTAFLALAATGARPTEVLSLKPSDVSEPKADEVGLRRDIAIRDSKTGEPRTVWVYGHVGEVLDEALRLARGKEYIFQNRAGGPTDYTVYGRILRRAAKKADIGKPVYPYLTRHTFVTNMLRRGVKDKAIMAMTGHATRSMLDHYSHLTQEETLKEIAPHLTAETGPSQDVIEREVGKEVALRVARIKEDSRAEMRAQMEQEREHMKAELKAELKADFANMLGRAMEKAVPPKPYEEIEDQADEYDGAFEEMVAASEKGKKDKVNE